MTKDEYYVEIATAVSRKSTCLKRKYGAVIVKDDRIISTGYNGAPRGCTNCTDIGKCPRMNVEHNIDYTSCHAVHAEMNAVIQGTAAEMNGATLYLHGENVRSISTSTPLELIISYYDIDCCPMCKRAIINAGIKRVVMSSGIDYKQIFQLEVDVADFIKEMNGENGRWQYEGNLAGWVMKRKFIITETGD